MHKHKFEILWHTQSSPLIQLLHCPECNVKYWGFDGVLYKPKVIHQVKDDVSYAKYLSATNVGPKSGPI